MSLLAKVMKGGGFRGLLNYLRSGSRTEPRVPPGEIVGGNLAGADPRQLAAELKAVRQLRPDCKKPVLHVSLSLPSGQDLTREQWQAAAAAWMKNMGIAESTPHVLFKHSETDHQHIHLVVSRIALDGTLQREQRGDFKKAHAAAAAASLAVGLDPQAKPVPEQRKPRVTKHDRREIEAGETPARLALAASLDEAIAQGADWEDVKARAASLDVEIQESRNAGGIYGIKLRLRGGDWIKGSQIGKAYTYSSILKRLGAGGADRPHGPTGKPRRDILERLQAQQTASGTVYRWASGHVAVVDLGSALQWRTGSAAEAAALAAVAKAKGWQSVSMADRGSAEKNDAAWLAYNRAGITVTNIKPSEEVYAKWLAERDRQGVGLDQPASPTTTTGSGEDRAGAADRRPTGRDTERAVAPVQSGEGLGIPEQLEQSGSSGAQRGGDGGRRHPAAPDDSRGSRHRPGQEPGRPRTFAQEPHQSQPADAQTPADSGDRRRRARGTDDRVHPSFTQESTHGNRYYQPHRRRTGGVPPPRARGRLQSLSELDVVSHFTGCELLLQSDVRPHLDQSQPSSDPGLRRSDPTAGAADGTRTHGRLEVLSAEQERALRRDLPGLVARFARRGTTDLAKREIDHMLLTQLQDRLRRERDDTERRRLLLQFSANLIAPTRAPEGLDDARNLLARTASQEAMEAAIKAASEQQRPAPTSQPAPGPRRTPAPGMNP